MGRVSSFLKVKEKPSHRIPSGPFPTFQVFQGTSLYNMILSCFWHSFPLLYINYIKLRRDQERAVMNLLLRSVLFSGALYLSLQGMAQNNAYPYKVAHDLALWHDNVDKEQQKFIIAGGRNDTLLRLAKDE